ncbi:hypothetical protein SO802_012711 [Lithocarpus litseifolius]|uniref:Ankyrin repeat-containing protein n=1 Tax=Lithocarpus litseifolius TaxID=425828 RepID=A0AAW2D757_9ROSI
MPNIQRKITKKEETTLHIAAAASQEVFVKNLVKRLSSENLTAENIVGNTALTYAAATGNVNIAKAMLKKNSNLPNLGSGVKPLFMAASLGHSQMVQFLYSETKEIVCGGMKQAKLFITCVEGDLYGLKLEYQICRCLAAVDHPLRRLAPLKAALELGCCPLLSLHFHPVLNSLPVLGEIRMAVLRGSDDTRRSQANPNFGGVALEMLKANPNFATTRNTDEDTVLHVLARNPSAFVSRPLWLLSFSLSIPGLKLKQENSKQSQANELFENCLQAYRGDIENSSIIPHVLFDAAESGNIECLIKLIRFDFDLLWKTRNSKSMFHVAVEKRHESIFNILNEIGSIGDLIINTKIEKIGNILHLAAELAPREKLNAISGAALQMQREILWFKEVEKVVPPAFKEMKNGNGEKPYVLFARTHEELRTKAEKWMMDTSGFKCNSNILLINIPRGVKKGTEARKA